MGDGIENKNELYILKNNIYSSIDKMTTIIEEKDKRIIILQEERTKSDSEKDKTINLLTKELERAKIDLAIEQEKTRQLENKIYNVQLKINKKGQLEDFFKKINEAKEKDRNYARVLLINSKEQLENEVLKRKFKHINRDEAISLLKLYFCLLEDEEALLWLTEIFDYDLLKDSSNINQIPLIELLWICFYFNKDCELIEKIDEVGNLLKNDLSDIELYHLYFDAINDERDCNEVLYKIRIWANMYTLIDLDTKRKVINKIEQKLLKKIKLSQDNQIKELKSISVCEVYKILNKQVVCSFCNKKLETKYIDLAYFGNLTTEITKGYMQYELLYCKSCNVAFATEKQLEEIKKEAAPDSIKIRYKNKKHETAEAINSKMKNSTNIESIMDNRIVENDRYIENRKSPISKLCSSCKERNECMKMYHIENVCKDYIKGTATIDYTYK